MHLRKKNKVAKQTEGERMHKLLHCVKNTEMVTEGEMMRD